MKQEPGHWLGRVEQVLREYPDISETVIQGRPTLNRYSTALSGLLKLAVSALTTCSLSNPMAMMLVTIASYSGPRTKDEAEDWYPEGAADDEAGAAAGAEAGVAAGMGAGAATAGFFAGAGAGAVFLEIMTTRKPPSLTPASTRVCSSASTLPKNNSF